MKDIDELMARIDGFEPLPVSEETLGAYLEGTLPDAVADELESIIDGSPLLTDMLDDIQSLPDTDCSNIDFFTDSENGIIGDISQWQDFDEYLTSINDDLLATSSLDMSDDTFNAHLGSDDSDFSDLNLYNNFQ